MPFFRTSLKLYNLHLLQLHTLCDSFRADQQIFWKELCKPLLLSLDMRTLFFSHAYGSFHCNLKRLTMCIFGLKNEQFIFDPKNACHLTFLEIMSASEFFNVVIQGESHFLTLVRHSSDKFFFSISSYESALKLILFFFSA